MAPESAKPILKVLSEGAAILSSPVPFPILPATSTSACNQVHTVRCRIIARTTTAAVLWSAKSSSALLQNAGGFRSRSRAGQGLEFARQRAELDDRQLLGTR